MTAAAALKDAVLEGQSSMVGRSRVLSDSAVDFENAETIGSNHLQGAQVPGRVEVGMVRMAAPYATEPVALSVSPVLLETHMIRT